jgi:hypothetical protein
MQLTKNMPEREIYTITWVNGKNHTGNLRYRRDFALVGQAPGYYNNIKVLRANRFIIIKSRLKPLKREVERVLAIPQFNYST